MPCLVVEGAEVAMEFLTKKYKPKKKKTKNTEKKGKLLFSTNPNQSIFHAAQNARGLK